MGNNKKKIKRKNKNKQQAPLSPEKYIATYARKLPIYRCLVNENWEKAGEAIAVVMRKHTSGNVTAAIFLVDVWAYGMKDTFFFFNGSEEEVLGKFSHIKVLDFSLTDAPYALIHNLVYGAVDFADEHGMRPHKMFDVTMHLLEEDNDSVEFIEIPFGIDGKPFFIDSMVENEDEDEDGWFDGEDEREDEEDTDYWSPHWNPFAHLSIEDWSKFLDQHKVVSETDFHYICEIFYEKWLMEHYQVEDLIQEYSLWTKGQLTFALREDTDDITEDEEYEELRTKLFQITVEKKNMENVEVLLNDYGRKHLDDPEVLLFVSEKFAAYNFYEQQLKALEDILKRFPDFLPAKFSKASYWLKQNKILEAKEVLQSCEGLLPFISKKCSLNEDEACDFYSIMGWIALLEKEYLKGWMHFRWVLDHLDMDRTVSIVIIDAENYYYTIQQEKTQEFLVKSGFSIPKMESLNHEA